MAEVLLVLIRHGIESSIGFKMSNATYLPLEVDPAADAFGDDCTFRITAKRVGAFSEIRDRRLCSC